MTERRFGKTSRDLLRRGEPIRPEDDMAANGIDAAWGQQHIRVTGIIGVLGLVVILLGVSLGWLVWTVGLDHRGTVAEIREQFGAIRRSQDEAARANARVADELIWVLMLPSAEREMLRQRLAVPERFRR